jgi:hypothetical protein
MSESTTLKPEKPSQVPSWIMVGFVVGVLTMWAFRSGKKQPEPAPVAVVVASPTALEMMADEPNPTTIEGRPSLEVVEALFEELSAYAFWSDDRTEIAVWNGKTLSFSDYFEVLRGEQGWYFRSMTRFSRLPLEGYGPEASPILFTETSEQRMRRAIQLTPERMKDVDARVPVDFENLPLPPDPGT